MSAKLFGSFFLLLLLFSCGQEQDQAEPELASDELIRQFQLNQERLSTHFRNTDSAVHYGNKLLGLAREINESQYLGLAFNAKASAFDQLEQYDSAIYYFEQAEAVLIEVADTTNLAISYSGLGHIYMFEGSYELSLSQYQKTIDLLDGSSDINSLSKAYSNIGMVLMEREMHDQARTYYQQAIDIARAEKVVSLELPPLLNLSLSYLKQQVYDSAIVHAENMKSKSEQIGMDFGIGKATYILAEAYAARGDLNRADKEARLGEQIFTALKAERDLSGLKYQRAIVSHRLGKHKEALKIIDTMLSKAINEDLKVDVLKLKADIFESLGNTQESLVAYKAYVEAADVQDKKTNERLIIQQQFRFDTEQKNRQIENLQTQATITSLLLEQERTRLYIAIASIAILAIGAYLVFSRHKAKAQSQLTEVQNRLLRTQLNPHFLFNAMGAIQQYIYSNEDPQLISDYLGKFSRLTRMILNYSRQDLISLEEELEFLKNYIELQQIRFEVPFEFRLELSEDLATDELLVPPMLTQPFIENAIEHGFLHKEEQGHIDLIIKETDRQLLITVKDDGIGRVQASTLAKKTKHESMATQITIERLKLIQKKLRQKSELLIKDLMDQHNQVTGTQVQLNIPLIKE
ncbi:MAG: histidine kinase [Roseivirga sp.]|nr:histidine kinase [Roseivirga sp.]